MTHIELLTSPLGKNEVTSTTIKNEAVSGEKVLKSGNPTGTPVTEGTFVGPFTLAVARSVWVGYTSKGEANEVIKKVKHFLLSEAVAVIACYNVKTGKVLKSAGAVTIPIKEVHVESTEEVEIVLASTPAAKDELYFLIVGT